MGCCREINLNMQVASRGLSQTHNRSDMRFFCILCMQEVQQAKYLGVTINNKLSWSDHIKIISNKANSVVGFLRRNFSQCPTRTKSALYLSLERPILEYAATVWAPYHHTDIYQLEAVQRRATRFVMNSYDRYQSITDMLCSLEWPILAQHTDHSKIIMLYKIVHNIVHIQLDIPLTYSNAVY